MRKKFKSKPVLIGLVLFGIVAIAVVTTLILLDKYVWAGSAGIATLSIFVGGNSSILFFGDDKSAKNDINKVFKKKD